MGQLYCLDFRNGKSYIGITERTAIDRLNDHKKCVNTGDTPVYNAWRKHGAPELRVLAIVENDDLAALEIRAIKAFNTLDPGGYNLSFGGSISPSRNPAIAAKISKSNKGRICSEYTRQKLRESMYGNTNSLGKRLSDEHKRKIGEAIKGNKNSVGRVLSEEHKEKISRANLGIVRSEETRRKMSESKKRLAYERRFKGQLDLISSLP